MKAQSMELTDRRIDSAPAFYRWMVGGEAARFAVVTGRNLDVKAVERYLPSNYGLCESFPSEDGRTYVIVGGVDSAGWTLDGYVIPRLRSGNYGAREIGA